MVTQCGKKSGATREQVRFSDIQLSPTAGSEKVLVLKSRFGDLLVTLHGWAAANQVLITMNVIDTTNWRPIFYAVVD